MDTSMSEAFAESVEPQTPPIIFGRPGLQPDVSLQVFRQMFHVHSAVLKMKSTFFYKFLDSEDKASRPRPQGKFTYEWVTTIDDDGTWHLVSSSSPLSNLTTNEHSGDPEAEIEALDTLLRAMYSRKFSIDSVEQLERVVELADYYRALPALSSGPDGAFHRSPALIEATHVVPHRLIKYAVQLRNEVLYRECMIQCMGPWTAPKYNMIEDVRIRKIAHDAHSTLCRLNSEISYNLWNTMSLIMRQNPNDQRLNNLQTLERRLATHCIGFVSGGGRAPIGAVGMLVLPWFYRKLYEAPEESVPATFKVILHPLMSNNLVLDPKHERAGEGRYRDYFFCLNISDEDLPWDTERTDW